MFTASRIKGMIDGIQQDCIDVLLPPEAGLNATGQSVVPFALLRGTKGYIERIAHQVNGCYDSGWYDASAVMIRRLLETLIIETFECYGISNNIKNNNGDFYYLSDLIRLTLSETSWNLSRNCKQALPKLKDIGDKSAHSRRFNAIRIDIDRIKGEVRTVVQEFVYLAKLK